MEYMGQRLPRIGPPDGVRGFPLSEVRSDSGVFQSDLREPHALETDYKCIVAIDFGTKYSGYAFWFRTENLTASQLEDITVQTNWDGGSSRHNYKCPTIVLLKENDDEFLKFGQAALEFYLDLPEEEEPEYLLFESFKMTLYTEVRKWRQAKTDFNRKYELEARNGKKRPALEVFAKAMLYLKNNFKAVMFYQIGEELKPDEMLWAVTVPAIWDNPAKQFMREAAHKAGLIDNLESKRLIIVLEPEAAALHCRSLALSGFHGESGKGQYSPPTAGHKYIVIDAGGGTVDIAVHEVVEDNKIREIELATGGKWGGTRVDEVFVDLLRSIFTREYIDFIIKKNPQIFAQLMEKFEAGKMTCGFQEFIGRDYGDFGDGKIRLLKHGKDNSSAPEEERVRLDPASVLPQPASTGEGYASAYKPPELTTQTINRRLTGREQPLRVMLPPEFCSLLKDQTGKNIVEWVKFYCPDGQTVKYSGGALSLRLAEARDLFLEVIEEIQEEVRNLLKKDHLKDVQTVYLVGGFADCALLRHELRTAFPHVRLLVPTDTAMAVLKGAVRYAREPTIVKERVMRYTYGTDYAPIFREGEHLPTKKKFLEGKYHCTDVFFTYVKKNQKVANPETISHGFSPIQKYARRFVCRIFASPKEEVQYCDDAECKEIGVVDVDLIPSPGAPAENRPCSLTFEFGGTELKCVAIDNITGNSRQITINFLRG